MNTKLAGFLKQNQFVAGILFLLLLWFIYLVHSILIALFVAYIIMAALTPLATTLKRLRLPNGLAVGLSFLVVIFIFLLLIVLIVPFFADQVQALILNFPYFLNRAASVFGFSVSVSQLQDVFASELNTIGHNAVSLTRTVFGGVFSIITILVVSFYLLLDHERIHKTLLSFFPKTHHENVRDLSEKIEDKLGAWLRGQFVLSIFIGVITWIALTIVGLPYALPLAILAGMLEIVPTLGPLLSAVPAVIVALTVSPTLGLIVAAIYFFIQLLENNLLVPRIMERAVGLNPIVVIVGILVGGDLFGIAGALLSIPFISCVVVIINHYKDR